MAQQMRASILTLNGGSGQLAYSEPSLSQLILSSRHTITSTSALNVGMAAHIENELMNTEIQLPLRNHKHKIW